MIQNNVAIAEAYYTAMSQKNIAGVAKCLHPDVKFSAPLAKVEGKEAVVENTKKFMAFYISYIVRATCGSGDQVMLAYDLAFPAPIGIVATAGLLTFKDGLIVNVELFYDARPFEKKA